MGKSRKNLTCVPHAVITAAVTHQQDIPSTSGREQQQHLENCYALESAMQAHSISGSINSQSSTMTRYLCYFLHRLLDFRIPELKALAGMFGVPDVQYEPPFDGNEASPFWYVHLPSELVAQQIVDRAVLMRCMLELWGEGATFEELRESVRSCSEAVKAPYMGPDCSFRVMLDAWGHTWTDTQQKELFDQLAEFLPFEGKVDLRQPQQIFWLCCVDQGGKNGLPDMPKRWYFGRQVALADRSWVKEFALPKRAYIGPTSMDPEVAFLMTNMAQIKRHHFVLDPYVGTGSILIAAAARGAYTMGTDIDVRVLKQGKKCSKTGRPVDIYSNYEQYGFQYPVGLVRMDVHTHPFRTSMQEVFNAIIGDPPYGVRAGGRKSVPKPEQTIRYRATHIPSTDPYSLTECLVDLLEFAAVTLVTGGRLVFFMPASPETYREDQLPIHPMLELVDNSEQPLTTRYSRRLITMQKVKPYDAAVAAQFKEDRKDFVMDIDRLHEIVYAQEQADAANSDATSEAGSGGSGVINRTAKPKYRSKMC